MRNWLLIILVAVLVFMAGCAMFELATRKVAKAAGIDVPAEPFGFWDYVLAYGKIGVGVVASGYAGKKFEEKFGKGLMVAKELSGALYKAKQNPTTEAIQKITDDVGIAAENKKIKALMDKIYEGTKVKAL